MICKTCTKEFKEHYNTQRYCSDNCTPYKNKFMAWDTWRSMHKRCKDPKTNGYERYGGSGITVCPEWEDYHKFISDMGLKPDLSYQLDRVDSEKGYYKDNCRWVPHGVNQRRSKRTRLFYLEGKEFTLQELAKLLGLSSSSLATRIENWGFDGAISKPHGTTGPKRN